MTPMNKNVSLVFSLNRNEQNCVWKIFILQAHPGHGLKIESRAIFLNQNFIERSPLINDKLPDTYQMRGVLG